MRLLIFLKNLRIKTSHQLNISLVVIPIIDNINNTKFIAFYQPQKTQVVIFLIVLQNIHKMNKAELPSKVDN